jgi:PAS domain S-box-containing protein
LRAVLDTAVEGIITIDQRGVIESVNPAAERIFGYTAPELVGRPVNILMPSPYREQHDGYLAHYLATGNARIIGIGREVVGRRKDGSIFPMDLAVSELQLASGRMFTGFVRDITERKRMEQDILHVSEREQQRIGRDLHDGLGQHLAGIEMMSQVLGQQLRRQGLTAEAGQAENIAGHVREAISHARRLARGLAPVVLESAGLEAALRDLAENATRFFGIPCRVRTGRKLGVSDPTVSNHLYRIAQEALSNALKHSATRRLEIRLGAQGDELLLEIRDWGRGLGSSPPSASSMGLRIMQYRAQSIGGRCTIATHRGGGTLVTCAVPRSTGINRS